MQLRLPELYCDAKQALEDCLTGRRLRLNRFNSTFTNMCEVTSCDIEEHEDEYMGSIKVSLVYKERIITKYNKFETMIRNQTLTILATKGDPIWPYIMTCKVWNGEYPSAVAVNEDTGVVYLVYLLQNALGLTEFSVLKDNQLEAFRESINDLEPYKIKVDEDAMFKVLAEEEGNRVLHEMVYVEFDCGVKFRVYSDKKFGV